MKIAILGASGLIGHQLLNGLGQRFGQDNIKAVIHRKKENVAFCPLFDDVEVIDSVEAVNWPLLEGVLHAIRPDVILNCIGITKRRPEVNDALVAIPVNALLPHRLANWGKDNGARVIHFSTDCVFNGQDGNYTEESITCGEDEYGRTKALGEIRYPHSLTIRSSFIGRELDVFSELLAWFLQQEGQTIKGFTNALYTGVSTIQMTRIVGDIIEKHPDLGGLYQLSTKEPINKYDLLCTARDAFGLNVEIKPDDSFHCDASMSGDKLRAAIGYEVPSWKEMMEELAADDLYDCLKAKS